MKIETAFGMILKQRRTIKKLSQEEFAFLCGLDRTYISLLERGKRKPTITTIFSISNILEIEPHILILETEKLLKSSQ